MMFNKRFDNKLGQGLAIGLVVSHKYKSKISNQKLSRTQSIALDLTFYSINQLTS